MSRCIGCGIKIQSNDQNKPGYLPEVALIERGENVYCKRCYDIRHHNLKYIPENNLQNYSGNFLEKDSSVQTSCTADLDRSQWDPVTVRRAIDPAGEIITIKRKF